MKPLPIPEPSPKESDLERLIHALRSGTPLVVLYGHAGIGKRCLFLTPIRGIVACLGGPNWGTALDILDLGDA